MESEPARAAGAVPKTAGRASAGVRVARSPRLRSEIAQLQSAPLITERSRARTPLSLQIGSKTLKREQADARKQVCVNQRWAVSSAAERRAFNPRRPGFDPLTAHGTPL